MRRLLPPRLLRWAHSVPAPSGVVLFQAVYPLFFFWLILHPALNEPRSLTTALGGGLLLLFLKPPSAASFRILGRWPALFLVYAFLTSFWAVSPGVALQSAGLLLLGTLLTLQWVDCSPAARERMRILLSVGLVAVCLAALHQRFVVFDAVGSILPTLSGEERDIAAAAVHHRRVYGTLGTPGSLAALLLLFLPMAMEWFRRNDTVHRLGGLFLILLIAPVLYFTGSIGALVALLGAMLLFLLHKRRTRSLRILLGVGVLILGVAILLRGPSHWVLSSFQNRGALWGAAFKAWLDLPVLGWGWGQFEEAYRSLGVPLSEGSKYAHNTIFQVMVEGGIVGLLLLGTALISLVGRARVPGKPTPLAALTGAVAFLLFSLLDLPLVMPELIFILPLFLSELVVRPGKEWDPWDSLMRRLKVRPYRKDTSSLLTLDRTFWPVMIVLAVAGFWPPFRPWSLALSACILIPAAAFTMGAPLRFGWGFVLGGAFFVIRAFLSPSSLGAVRFIETLALAGVFLVWMRGQSRPARALWGLLALPLLWSARAWWDTAASVPELGWRAIIVPISWTDYSNPRLLAVLTIPVLLLLLAAGLRHRGRLAAFLYGIASLIRLWSVAAYAGLTAAWAYLSARRWSKTRMIVVLVLITVALGALRILNPSPTKWDRLSIWRTAVVSLWQAPMLGSGPGVFPQDYERLKEPREDGATRYLMGAPVAHNDLLDLALAFGGVGFLIISWGSFAWWRRERDRARKAAVLGMGLTSSVQAVFHIPPAAMIGAALLSSGSPRPTAPPAFLAAGIALGLSLSLFGSAAFQRSEYRHAERLQSSGRLPAAYQVLKRAERLDAWDSRSYQATHSFEEEMYLRTGDAAWRSKSDATFDRMEGLEWRDGRVKFLGARRDAARALKTRDPEDVKGALAGWQVAREAWPRSANVCYEEGLFEVRMGLKDRAAGSFADAVALEPAFARAWLNLGNLLKEQGQGAAAQAAYRQALRADKRWKDAPLAPIERDLVGLPVEARRFAEREVGQ